MWETLIDYGRIKWQKTLKDYEDVLDLRKEDVLKEFDLVWCVRELISFWWLIKQFGGYLEFLSCHGHYHLIPCG